MELDCVDFGVVVKNLFAGPSDNRRGRWVRTE